MALYPRVTSLRDPFAVAGVAVALPSRTGGPPARDHAATAEADTWTRFPRSVPRSAPGHRVRRLVGSQLSFLASAAVDSAGFGPVRESRSSKSDRVRPVHRFNFPRLAAVLVIAVVGFVACAQGPGTPAGPPDTAPAFVVTVADQTFTEGEPISPLTLPEASGGNGPLSYSLAPTVPGMTFAAATRTLSGTPAMAGSYNVEYRVEDGDANTAASDAATLSFTVTVAEAPEPDTAPSFGNQTVPDQSFTVGEAISALVLPAASGGNGSPSYSLTPSIPGLTFAQNSRTLSGTPTTAGTYNIEYRVEDGDANTASSDAAALNFTVTVEEAPAPDTLPSFGLQTVPNQSYTVGVAIRALVLPQASGGNGSLTYSLQPSIPGLSFDQNSRTLTGTPTTAGTYHITYQVQDGDANTTASDAATLTFAVNVKPASTSYMGCSADAETWRGLRVCTERPRDGYDRDAFGTGYRTLEDDIIAALPATMKENGQVYTPYSCIAFDITPSGTAATDIEHIVALAEAHDSGIADDQRWDIASDLDNLTIADPTVNRSQKGARDAAEWMPTHHGVWFAERVIQVKLEYGLTVDPAERDALEALLAGGGAQLNCVD